MLTKNEMVQLIESFDSWTKINNVIKDLTEGYGITNPMYSKIDIIGDIIKSNSKYNGSDDASSYAYFDIMYNDCLTPEEKYNLLK